MEKSWPKRQTIKPVDDVCMLGLYVNETGKLFYAGYEEHAANRIKPESVWLDENGLICAKVERRLPEPPTKQEV